jgi:hypothetical protein
VTTGARVGRRDENEIGREHDGAARSHHADLARLERLPKRFQVASGERADLVEEENPMVSEAVLT